MIQPLIMSLLSFYQKAENEAERIQLNEGEKRDLIQKEMLFKHG